MCSCSLAQLAYNAVYPFVTAPRSCRRTWLPPAAAFQAATCRPPTCAPASPPRPPPRLQAQQAATGELVGQLMEQNRELGGEVAALRKQLAALTTRRDAFLWL